jgi:integrase
VATIQPVDGRWRAQVRRKGHQPISKRFRTKAAAEAWARSVEDAMERGEFSAGHGLTVGQAVERFMESHAVSKTKRANLNQWRDGPAGGVPLSELTAAHVIAHCQQRTCGPATLAMEVAFLREVLEYARTAWEARVGDPVKDARPTLKRSRLVAKSKERDRRPTPDELKRLRAYLSANKRMPMADLMDFAIATAMRLGELVRIAWADYDEVKGLMLIRERKHPVTKKDEWVPILPDAKAILARQARTDARVWPYHPDSISRAFLAACKALGIGDLRWHDLRHEGTSRLFEQGYQIQEVALVTGHKDWHSLKRYTNLKPESLHR